MVLVMVCFGHFIVGFLQVFDCYEAGQVYHCMDEHSTLMYSSAPEGYFSHDSNFLYPSESVSQLCKIMPYSWLLLSLFDFIIK